MWYLSFSIFAFLIKTAVRPKKPQTIPTAFLLRHVMEFYATHTEQKIYQIGVTVNVRIFVV
ncbi:hypothetical protein EH55_11810 [Synergistes jonesii]|uniref:Uncharacterized protein n=1 Tax=Synergistes jonesii TaxID=2754 RepID=A0A073J0M2_9BACT|nr:hypothetical protein EH55_11810 [Synergistes jonesii]